MEAMACRLPIIMVGMQLSHLVDYNNGMKFPEHDREKLKIALEKMINDKKLRLSMADNSFKAVKGNYSYDIIAKQFLELARK